MREKLYSIIKKADSGDILSKAYDIFIVITAFASVIPLMFKTSNVFLDMLDIVTLYILFADYVFRWITNDYATEKNGIIPFLKYPVSPFAILALASLLPSMGILGQGFRLLRMFRIFTVFHYSDNFRYIADVFKKERKTLVSVLWIAIFYIFISALLMFAYEPDTFESFFDALYWATTALTTVGYGDVFPTSAIGKLISMISSLFGIAVIALPAGIVTAGFVDEVNKNKAAPKPQKDKTIPTSISINFTDKLKRYTIVMLICFLLNIVLNLIAEKLNLPVWLDTTGTILAAIVLEPAAGLIVGLLNNMLLSIMGFGVSSILYYVVSVAAALITGLMVKRGEKFKISQIFFAALAIIAASTVLAGTIDLIIDKGAPPSTYWESIYYNFFSVLQIPHVLSYYLSEFVVKICDTLATFVVVLLAYFALPKHLKFSKAE